MVKPPKEPYTGDEMLDSLVRMNTELLSELWILRDRVTILEAMLEDKGVVSRQAITDFVPEGALAAELDRERNELVRKVVGGAWLQGFSVESLLDSVRQTEKA